MPKKYPWSTEGLQKYSERLKCFIHERCTCYPPVEDDMFEVPEFMVIDPLKRRPSKFRLSFVDDFPYTRLRDNDYENERTPCTCNLCPLCNCDMNLKPIPHFVLNREELPQWIQRDEVHFRHSATEENFSSTYEEGAQPSSSPQPMKQQKKMKPREKKNSQSQHQDEQKENQPKQGDKEPENLIEPSKPLEIRKKISAFSFDESPSAFPYL